MPSDELSDDEFNELDIGEELKNVVALDLGFLCNVFMREGSKINLEVLEGVPEGANAIAAGLVGETLFIVFDRDVPNGILYKDSFITESNQSIN